MLTNNWPVADQILYHDLDSQLQLSLCGSADAGSLFQASHWFLGVCLRSSDI